MFQAPYPPYDPTDTSGFSYDTVVKRWPIILTNIIDHVHRLLHDMTLETQQIRDSDVSKAEELSKKITEGQEIISEISRLKYRMARDHELENIPQDGDILVAEYNAELESLKQTSRNTWFQAPWLYAEYRLIRAYFNQKPYWRGFDPFSLQKEEMFKNSGAAIYQIATTMHELESEKVKLQGDSDKLEVLFKEMIYMCLWLDLSLLTHLSPSDIEHLQTVGKEAQEARSNFILKDDQGAVWSYIKTLANQGKRLDFVLDNDFVFADFLVTYTPYFSQVVFHPKLFPWFVSDVTPTDFANTISSLLSTTFFPPNSATTPDSVAHLQQMVTRWKNYIDEGIFTLATDISNGQKMTEFWNGPWPYWNMNELAPDGSGLVIFKVSSTAYLNFEFCVEATASELAGDVRWPVSTPFPTAIGPLAGSFPLLSLRTNKADVAVGIDEKVAENLDKKGEKWRISGKYALVSFLPRRIN
ncbi:uncharacterized protein EDB93DRAFT_1156180 [Suillus bovinus]|uniref:uncharacterized protein n=1 Tax=Suillus bovinus TaxID=48563 RepID=UPI001B87318F|nr:uncharacterized protein EDB93DRAFT_1156180 [Suillus bovinus]KAG2143434.1 hypothetical protein EDB93DRAFT_1156180 [Suillus bovinus]